MYPRANQDPQLISLTTKTSVYPNLVVSPHSGEKPMNKVREAGKVINKRVPNPIQINFVVSHIFERTHGRFCGDFPPFCVLAPRRLASLFIAQNLATLDPKKLLCLLIYSTFCTSGTNRLLHMYSVTGFGAGLSQITWFWTCQISAAIPDF